MKLFKNIDNCFVISISTNFGRTEITESEYDTILQKIRNKPTDPEGYQYKLRDDNLEWELVKLPPIEPETLTDEEALTRYANSLTGANDQTLTEAAETLIDKYSESKDKSEAYDILIGGVPDA